MVTHDVIPNGLVHGARGELEGLNLVGLKRRGVAREDIAALRAAFEALRGGEGSFVDRVRGLDAGVGLVRELADFVLAPSHRQFLTPG
jgi:UDP-N-acetylglucosamine acyltransferase